MHTIRSPKILWSYSLVSTLHRFIIIITQKCLRALNLQYASQIAKFMGPTWGPPWSCQPQMGPVMAPWTLLSWLLNISYRRWIIFSLLTCMQYIGPYVFSWSILFWWLWIVSDCSPAYHHKIGNLIHQAAMCRVKSRNNGMCLCFIMFLLL